MLLKVSFIILRHYCTHWPCWLGGASSLTKTLISQSALCTFASASTLVMLALCWNAEGLWKGLKYYVSCSKVVKCNMYLKCTSEHWIDSISVTAILQLKWGLGVMAQLCHKLVSKCEQWPKQFQHPATQTWFKFQNGTMAQWVRALAYGAEGPQIMVLKVPRSKSAQSQKISCYDWLVMTVVFLGKALYSHLPCWPERIREVLVMGNIKI